jgi:hypothetical protein
MNHTEVSVIGRITPTTNGGLHEYWETRNFIHLHWVATRQIIIYGQGGVDKTISVASSALGDEIFLDKIVASFSQNKPVTDDDLIRFHLYELPFLKQMADGKITVKDFEQPLIKEVGSRVNWLTFATNGFEPFLGFSMLLGGIIIYMLIRQPDETEVV